MKYLLLLVLLVAVACQPVIDPRDPATAAATQTAIAAQPVTGNVGVLRVRLLNAPPIPTIEPVLLPTVTPTPECVNAKANISASGERIYHLPGQANYNTVKIDKDGEAVYCTAAEAEAAGFRKALR